MCGGRGATRSCCRRFCLTIGTPETPRSTHACQRWSKVPELCGVNHRRRAKRGRLLWQLEFPFSSRRVEARWDNADEFVALKPLTWSHHQGRSGNESRVINGERRGNLVQWRLGQSTQMTRKRQPFADVMSAKGWREPAIDLLLARSHTQKSRKSRRRIAFIGRSSSWPRAKGPRAEAVYEHSCADG